MPPHEHEPTEEEEQQMFAEAVNELFETGEFRYASCLLCRREGLMVSDSHKCPHCFYSPAEAARLREWPSRPTWERLGTIDPRVFRGEVCKACLQPFEEGDEIIDRGGEGIYFWSWHQACAEAIGVEWEDPDDES